MGRCQPPALSQRYGGGAEAAFMMKGGRRLGRGQEQVTTARPAGRTARAAKPSHCGLRNHRARNGAGRRYRGSEQAVKSHQKN